MSSILKVDQIQLSNGNTPTAGDLGLNTTGNIINVYEARKTDVQSISNFTFVDVSGLSITLTPVSSSSKFLITMNVRATSNYFKSNINLLRGSTVLFANADGAGDNRLRTTSSYATNQSATNTHGFMHHHNLTILDAPATASSLTYKIQAAGRGQGASQITYINRSVSDRALTEYDDRTVSSILIQEIAG